MTHIAGSRQSGPVGIPPGRATGSEQKRGATCQPMQILFLHRLGSTPGGLQPTYLSDHGHAVIHPRLSDADFKESVRVAQSACDRHRPDVVVGSSRGGAAAGPWRGISTASRRRWCCCVLPGSGGVGRRLSSKRGPSCTHRPIRWFPLRTAKNLCIPAVWPTRPGLPPGQNTVSPTKIANQDVKDVPMWGKGES